MIEVQDIFEVKYGVNLELNKLTLNSQGINFVSRTAKNNGVSAKVDLIDGVTPIPAGVLTVAGGGSVLETFLQPEPFYSGRDLYYLQPKVELSDAQKLYYCACIKANKFKYSYGRQANRTLKYILIPKVEDIPHWIKFANLKQFNDADEAKIKSSVQLPSLDEWKEFKYSELFSIERGRGPRKKDLDGSGSTPFITSIDSNNGLTNYTQMKPIHYGNVITVNRNGSVAEAYYQEIDFCSTEDVHVFNPKFKLNKYIAMFLITLIKKEKYRYNYGRKWGIGRMNNTSIYLPVDTAGVPNWGLIEGFIKSQSFSSKI
ncbi:hypothetical protein A6E05_05990 [Aliivibrio sp. 1S165]|uniref:restriction endonuclease subunit S n=1 Tax=unclassified Aliivibrio TaxID=2645654 RepID=UPI00080EE78C|nr:MULTISPECIES: restriction endonuclease subunit S [unclassified Aliivibrio]OCH12691.1 hypothetical protein A6E05_05990 [Aliivibrio sp. 1S165]OCH36371.1 hypothetical protein A6E06_00195 [Aliivibrio sp. 1S175]